MNAERRELCAGLTVVSNFTELLVFLGICFRRHLQLKRTVFVSVRRVLECFSGIVSLLAL